MRSSLSSRTRICSGRSSEGSVGWSSAGVGAWSVVTPDIVAGAALAPSQVLVEDETQADQGEPGVVHGDPARLVDDQGGQSPGGDDRAVRRVTELGQDLLDDAVDLPGEAVQ